MRRRRDETLVFEHPIQPYRADCSPRVNFFDRSFSDTDVSYTRDRAVWNDITVFTDSWLDDPIVPYVRSPVKLGWMVEPRSINPGMYESIHAVKHHYHGILTHDQALVSSDPAKFIQVLHGNTWVEPSLRRTHHKSRDVVMLLSQKTFAPGHKLRRQVAEHLTNAPLGSRVDLFGAGVGRPVDRKDALLAPYRFAIEIENGSIDFYFTEKLIDCLLLGVVPIYYGCPGIGRFFDLSGILTFSDAAGLERLVAEATAERYEAMLPAVRRNFEIAQQFTDVHGWLNRHVYSKIPAVPGT